MSTQSSVTGGGSPGVVVVRERGGWFGKLLIFVGLVGVAGAAYLGLAAINILPSIFKNPFQQESTERTGPVLVESIQDASEFLAAEGSFQVVVDRAEGLRVLGVSMNWLSGCRAVFVGYGTVNATVEVGGLTEDAIEINGNEVTVTLPEPVLSSVDTDLTESYVLAEEQGFWQRFRGFIFGGNGCPSELELLQAAEGKIAEAAQQSDLIERAEENTRLWIEGMLRRMGYERITVNFEPNPV